MTISPSFDESTAINDDVLQQIWKELQRTRATLEDDIAPSGTVAEDSSATREELRTINRRLRAATEELLNRAEKLQMVNAELQIASAGRNAIVDDEEGARVDHEDLIVSNNIPLVRVDNDLHVRRYTPPAEDIFCILPSDVGRSLIELTHRLAYPQLAQDLTDVVRSTQPREREVQAYDGRSFFVRLVPCRVANGKAKGVELTFFDVSRLREGEGRALQGEDNMVAAMRRSSDFAVIATDPGGAITGWNSGAEAIFGYTQDEIAGLMVSVLFTPEDRAKGVDVHEMETARRTGRAEDNRWHLRRDGSRVFCSGVTTATNIGGLRGYVKIARDVTSQQMTEQQRERQLEQARLRRANAEAAMVLKDEFLAVMSHELKHPLNLIHVNTEIISRTAANALQAIPHAVRAMETLKHAIRTQGKIIDDLLDLSRVRTGKLTLDLVAVELVTLVGAAVEAIASDGRAAEIDIAFEASEPSVLVTGDVARLNQIVWNLLSNATKFTPPGGRILASVAVDAAYGRIDVADSGQGIDPAFLPRVFDMFGQARARASTSQAGLGIGLALVKQLAERHGGRVEGASDGLGNGARFSVWVPLYSRQLAVAPHAGDVEPTCAGRHVLIVDDDPLTVDSLRVLLELEGARVTTATSGIEALDAVQREAPELLLTDLGMPTMDGFQLLAAVRALPGLGSLPVIALTGLGQGNDVKRAHDAGFSAHISKPVRLGELWQRLAEVMEPATSGSPDDPA